VTDPEPIDFDFGDGSTGERAPGGAGSATPASDPSHGATPGSMERSSPEGDELTLDPVAEPVTVPPPPATDPLHAHAAAARASAAGAAFAVTSYPYAPAAIERAKPAWTHGATPQPWSRERRLTMGILLAVLAVVAAAVIALSIRAIDVFLRGG
jgi:hypothetical protein